MKYQSKIVGLGPDALAFLEDEDMNFIIIFNERCTTRTCRIIGTSYKS